MTAQGDGPTTSGFWRNRSRGRTATPLELLFDLVFVVAVAFAGSALHDTLVDKQVADAVLGYALVKSVVVV